MSHSPHAVLATLLVALALTACGGGATASVPVQPPTSLAQTPTTPVPTPTTRSAELTTLNEGLRAAAWTNDVTEARRLITLGADVNAKDETQQSAYLIATSEGYLDLLRLTLAHGAKVDDKDSWNGTGLIRAAERGHALVVGELLRAGIARDHINRIGYQAIHEAVWLGDDTPEYATTVRVLAAGGVELDRRAPSAELTPLEMARQIGHTGAAGILETITSAARQPIPTRHSCRPRRSATPTPSPSPCAPARTSRLGTRTTAPRSSWPPPTTGSPSRTSWSRWAPTPMRSTTATTLPGWSPA